jgi:hypothetical protein
MSLLLGFVGTGSNSQGGKPTYTIDPVYVQFSVSGGVAPYSWAISAGALPGGLTLATYATPYTMNALIAGNIPTTGAFSYTITVTDSSGTPLTASLTFSGTILALPNIGTGILGQAVATGPLSGLTLEAMPGFAEILIAALAYGLPLTSAVLKALNSCVKFAAVRTEFFFGYYCNGDTVGLPTSLIDGYQYAREELRYIWSIYWTGSIVGAAGGTLTPPNTGASSGKGQLLQCGYFIDPNAGAVSCNASYYQDNGQQTDTNDGILMVHTVCKRMR